MFSMSIRHEILKSIREKYPPGTAVEVVEFHDQYRDIPAGTKGRVLAVDDTGTSTGIYRQGQRAGYWRSMTRARSTVSSRTVYRSELSGGSTS